MLAQQITLPVSHHGEGAVWWPATRELRFVDMLAGAVIAVEADFHPYRMEIGSSVAACLRPRIGGGAVIARERDIAVCRSEDFSDLTTLTGEIVPEGLRFNEGGCDPEGAFYAGTMAYDRTEGVAELLRVDELGRVETILSGVTTSNGFAFSPDGSTAYYTDTSARRTLAFDYVAGQGLSNPRTVISYTDDQGRADGLCVDADGGLWVALNGAGRVHGYSPEGVLEFVVEVPVHGVTSCTFGSDDLGILFITTSRNSMAASEHQRAGALFATRPGVFGLPPLPFAG